MPTKKDDFYTEVTEPAVSDRPMPYLAVIPAAGEGHQLRPLDEAEDTTRSTTKGGKAADKKE